MTAEEIRITFPKRLKYFLDYTNKTQQELADYLGVHKSTVSEWVHGKKMPSIDRLDQICEFFGGLYRSDLLENKDYEDSDYYLNAKTREIAQAAYDDPNLQILFDASRKISPEDMQTVIDLVKRLGK